MIPPPEYEIAEALDGSWCVYLWGWIAGANHAGDLSWARRVRIVHAYADDLDGARSITESPPAADAFATYYPEPLAGP